MKKSHKHVKKIWGAIKKKRKPEKKAKKKKNSQAIASARAWALAASYRG